MCVRPRNSHPMANRALKDLLLVLAVAMTKCVWVKILAMADLFGSIYLDGDGAIISLLRLLYDMTKNDYINMFGFNIYIADMAVTVQLFQVVSDA